MKTREEILSRITALFSEHFSPEVLAVILFGSAAQQRIHPESDIDVAVLFRFEIPRERRKELLYAIYEQVPYYFIEPVDLVNLNDADLILCHQALTRGEIILCRDETAFKMFRDARILQYLDFTRFLEPFYPKISKKLLGKG